MVALVGSTSIDLIKNDNVNQVLQGDMVYEKENSTTRIIRHPPLQMLTLAFAPLTVITSRRSL